MNDIEKDLRTQLVRERAMRIKEHDDAYPDVGMGMSWGSCVHKAVNQLGYTDDMFNREMLFR